jgi:hypothetical protein
MRAFRHSHSIILVVTLIGAVAITGCRGVKFSQPSAPQLGEPSDAERQRQADSQARQLGEKPTPVDYSRK